MVKNAELWIALVVTALLAATACRDDPSAGDGGGDGDADGDLDRTIDADESTDVSPDADEPLDAIPTWSLGRIELNGRTVESVRFFAPQGYYDPELGKACRAEVIDQSCIFLDCGESRAFANAHAGPITISSGDTVLTELVPDANGVYPTTTEPWQTGGDFTVSAQGDYVPAFDITSEFPEADHARCDPQIPYDRAQGLTIGYSPNVESTIGLNLVHLETDDQIACIVESSMSTMSITFPPEVISRLDAGDVRITGYPTILAETMQGEHRIQVLTTSRAGFASTTITLR